MAAGSTEVHTPKILGSSLWRRHISVTPVRSEEHDSCVLQEADQYLAGVVDREAAAAANQEMPDVMADMQAGEDPCLVRCQMSWQTRKQLSGCNSTISAGLPQIPFHLQPGIEAV